MDSLNSFLAGLGPWGVVAGVVLTVAGQWVRNRMQPTVPPTPVAPAPPVLTPLPQVPSAPASPASNTPVIDAVLAFVRLKLLHQAQAAQQPALNVTAGAAQPAAPQAPDLGHPEAVDLLSKLFGPPK